jgi:hypothetical protein
MSELLDNIARAVERTVNCSVTHRESVPVVETIRGQTVWEVVVEVFNVAKPPPDTAYGWANVLLIYSGYSVPKSEQWTGSTGIGIANISGRNRSGWWR